ncbi:MAG: hypothetical protein GXN98_03035 [Euryarchaeota archaeon]|nr:hypothetical protein [Euryarchaeota archaeon]
MHHLRILAVDVGMGTQDVLLYDSSRNLENCMKMVLPSPTRVIAAKLRRLNCHVFLRGETMGGGPLTAAVAEHLRRGYRVAMTPSAAMSLRDDLEQVRAMGVEIAEAPPEGFEEEGYQVVETGDVNLELFRRVAEQVEERFEFDCIAVAVQDHGRAPPGVPDRVFRFENLQRLVEERRHVLELCFTSPPEHFTRMRAVERVLRRTGAKCLIADTKLAAAAGALHGVEERPAVAVDIGNGHTLVALVDEQNRLAGVLEHHTHMLNRQRLVELIRRFLDGEVSNREVYEAGGHGCAISEPPGAEAVRRVMVTGPHRMMLAGAEVEFAAPGGDVMLTGAVGLVDMALHAEGAL